MCKYLHVPLYISRVDKVNVLKSAGRFDFTLVAIINASRYSNGA